MVDIKELKSMISFSILSFEQPVIFYLIGILAHLHIVNHDEYTSFPFKCEDEDASCWMQHVAYSHVFSTEAQNLKKRW